MQYLQINGISVYPKTKFPTIHNTAKYFPLKFTANNTFFLLNRFHIAFVFVGRLPGPG